MTKPITRIDRLIELEPHLTKQRKLYRSVNLTGLDTEIILGAIAELKNNSASADNLYEALKKAKSELSALIHPALPGKPAISDWPCDNAGDRECLDEAWDIISVAIASVECPQS